MSRHFLHASYGLFSLLSVIFAHGVFTRQVAVPEKMTIAVFCTTSVQKFDSCLYTVKGILQITLVLFRMAPKIRQVSLGENGGLPQINVGNKCEPSGANVLGLVS